MTLEIFLKKFEETTKFHEPKGEEYHQIVCEAQTKEIPTLLKSSHLVFAWHI